MIAHFTYHNVQRSPQLDKAIESHVGKLSKLLVRFSPDLVRLHGALEFNSAHKIPTASVNLSLPTGQMHAREEGGTILTATQASFSRLIQQVKKHMSTLRKEAEWGPQSKVRAALRTKRAKAAARK